MANRKIYNLKQIEGACVIGSPIVAGILIAHNYRIFGKRQKGIFWIIIGIVWTFTLIGLGTILPENISKSAGMVFPFLNGAILYPIINRLQGDQIKEHFDNNGEKGSNWLIAGLTVAFVALILTPMILINKISPINNYTRQTFNTNGIYYNQNMSVGDVNKLGGILQRIEYFNPESPAEVVFLSTDTTYEFKLITEKSFFNDSIYLNEVQQIFNHVNSYKFKKPLIFKITDPLLKNDKVIALNNEENIPRLLEVVTFSQNHNFRLVYEKSIEKTELERFQKLIIEMKNFFPPQNKMDFLMEFENGNYSLRLIIPRQSWNDSQLQAEAKYLKLRLNEYGFDYPFKLLLVDNSSNEINEKEIE